MKNLKTDEQLKKEMIKKVDIKKCKKLYAMSLNIKDCDIKGFEKLLEIWAENKLHLYKLLGEELKINKLLDYSKEDLKGFSQDAVINITAEVMREKWIKFIKRVSDEIPYFYRLMDNTFDWASLARKFPMIDYGCTRHYDDLFFKNEAQIPLSKAIHMLCKSDYIDTELSKFIQENSITKVTGNMYVSIDPFDYLTMSVNMSDWHSCLSLHKDLNSNSVYLGEYCSGIFSYLCDKVTMVAYRTNGQDEKFSWSNRSFMAESKNWRQLIYMQEDFEYFINSRQYPFNSEFLGKIVREMVEKQIGKMGEMNETSQNYQSNSRKWKVSRNNERNRYKVGDVKDDEGIALQYNDVLHGREFTLTYKKKFDDLKVIKVGSVPFCPICGEGIIREQFVPCCYNCRRKIGL